MIHNVELHPYISNKLKFLMCIQQALLTYAAKHLTTHYEECKTLFNGSCTVCSKETGEKQASNDACLKCLEEKCREYLDSLKGFSGKGKKIAYWLYSSKERREPLFKFIPIAGEDFTQEQQKRLDWIEQMQKQTDALLNNERHVIMRKLYNSENKIKWQDAGASFLIQFYNDLKNGSGFPAAFFDDTTPFDRQTFLNAFLEKNNGLYICPICDETGYYTVARKTIRTDIEHYFPKSIYPHLAIHPYNLLPTCSRCNSIHGDKDPFDMVKSANNRLLGDVFLPYHGTYLSEKAYMNITLSKKVVIEKAMNHNPQENVVAEEATKLKFIFTEGQDLNPRPQYADDKELKALIDVLKNMYDIPARWQNQTDWTNKVGETLFRRLRQYLKDATSMPSDHDMLPVAEKTLNHLLYTLYKEDMRKDPYAFSMTWFLTKLLNEYVEPLKDQSERTPNGFLEEIDRWFKKNEKANADHTAVAEELKNLIKEGAKDESRRK